MRFVINIVKFIGSVAGQFLFLIIGIVIGVVSTVMIDKILGEEYRGIYFEPNDINNFFYKNKLSSAKMRDVVEGDWVLVCVIEKIYDPVAKIIEITKYKDPKIIKGDVVREGVNSDGGLYKIVFINDSGGLYVMNFDDVAYEVRKVGSSDECIGFNNAVISYSGVEKISFGGERTSISLTEE